MSQELMFALASANALRDALDRARVGDCTQQAGWVRAEAQKLQHLVAACSRSEEYPALSAGLAEFAIRIQEILDARQDG
ncbi:hypothetical protein GCM10011581_31490 [Saccharopolyspora subtropica]|uniref:Uncharacterized protein n=1 Tax=Saccharopolyspora thermophila TaxID=89367 RepID=A0A917NF76_9PSEU|nr:hypothetical protein [Saccharopolyspora subtropica]GGI92089.1 hypothetical protein GCM10011581_31490 [Saccharopolyspora subtropica]